MGAVGYCDYPDGGVCTGVANIAPVGTPALGAGRWGQLDLTGDVSEWTLDEFASSYVSPCVDCAYLDPEPQRSIRGGVFNVISTVALLASLRLSFLPAAPPEGRCVGLTHPRRTDTGRRTLQSNARSTGALANGLLA